ncbi:10467_t:CDS:2 [Racocetra persica]|uniref:10467_t:CDS:1 n=1 Tax=Racocetra persica TaxID=160502 RepID=A0ACA9Q0X8_9GLOM|nr:10467_t:CDS:2 [Racocetra persica]
MKALNFLFPILIVFAVVVRATEDYDEKNLTCEKLFNVSSCSDCQKLIFHDIKQDENDCPAPIRFIKEVVKVFKESGKEKAEPYNTTYFKKGLESYCDQPFNCDPRTAEKYWTEIEHVCAKELSYKVDWSVDPSKIDRNTFLVFGTLLSYYFGIPANHAYCYKSSNSDEFCMAKIYENMVEYVKKATNEDPKPVVSLDYKYIFKSDGTKIPIPKKLHCDEKCYETIAEMYKSWIKHYKLSPKVAENIFGSEDGFIKYLSCKADDKRDVIRRASDSYLSPLRLHSLIN